MGFVVIILIYVLKYCRIVILFWKMIIEIRFFSLKRKYKQFSLKKQVFIKKKFSIAV